LIAVAAVAVASGAATALLVHRGDGVDEVAVLMDESRYPTTTVADWVTYADHVVVATVAAEADGDHGELSGGSGFIDREVTLDVDDVLWSRPQPSRPIPDSVTVGAIGWSYAHGDSSDRVVLAVEDTPRLEVGHTYIVALDWVPARCDVGDEPEPAAWRALGSDAIVPYDDEVIGAGELEGREQTVGEVQATRQPGDPNSSFEDSMLGKSAADLKAALLAASPGSRAEMDRDEAEYACTRGSS